MKKIIFIISAILYGFLMWSAGWVSVRVYDSYSTSIATPATEESMLSMINDERQKIGVAPVVFDKRITKAAEDKACDMRDREYFDHKDPQGRWGWHFLTENDVFYNWAGENIAKDAYSPDGVRDMRGFMESPAHRSIILDPIYESVGYASCGLFTVQFFVK